MKNTECTIYISTKSGWTQKYRKEKDTWKQTCPNGKTRNMTPEQLLSHILPLLTNENKRLKIKVVKDLR